MWTYFACLALLFCSTYAAYCEPCWLFSVNKSEWTNRGVRTWKNLPRKIFSHSNSQYHIQSCKIYEQWKNNETIDKELEERIRYEASFWKMVLDRLFNITLMLAKHSVAFRGHRELSGVGNDSYNGNFLSQVELLSKYDDTMKQVWLMPAGMLIIKGYIFLLFEIKCFCSFTGSTRYLSPQIQNEIIHCLGTELVKTLVRDINDAPFFTIIMDTTQDINKVDQMSLIISYVKLQINGQKEITGMEILETFLGFFKVENHSAEAMAKQVMDKLKEYNIDMKNVTVRDMTEQA